MSDRHATLRILDANANRAMEGLRILEEYLRFVLSDRHLTQLCKHLRHELSAALQAIPSHERLTARDTSNDIGTQISAPDEYQRTSLREVYSANQKRVEQALRCLEEFSKPDYPNVAATIEQLRYRAYTLAKAVDTTTRSQTRLADAQLYVLLDSGSCPEEFERVARELIATGVCVLQLRDKQLSDRELLIRARQLRTWTRGTRTLCIVNDRPDLAKLADADGVHLGQDDLPVSEARAIVGADSFIGVSTHSLDQAKEAVLEGADYLGCGPTFPSTTKSFEQFPGPEFLRQVAAEISLPSFGIGGIDLENVQLVMQTGMRRIAVSGAITRAKDRFAAAQQLLHVVRSNRPTVQ